MSIEQYRSDGVTPLSGVAMTNVEAGADSDVLTIVMINEGDDRYDVPIAQLTDDPLNPGRGLMSGLPPQDEQWGRLAITAFDGSNTDEPDWSVELTGFVPVGAIGGLVVDFWPADGEITFQYKIHPPAWAEDASAWSWYLEDLGSRKSLPIPPSLASYDRGILPGIGDPSVSYIVSGLELTESGGGADEYLNVSAGFVVIKGRLIGIAGHQHELDQDDDSAATLGSGEIYYAILSFAMDGTVTATKGDKGADPDVPATPAGELRHPQVARVDYTGSTSEIETGDIEETLIYGRYYGAIGSGTTLSIHAGRAIGGGTLRYASQIQPVPLTDDSECYVWQLASGLFEEVVDDALTPPESTALGPFFHATTAGGAITDLVDLRPFASHLVILHITAASPASTGALASVLVPHHHLFIEDILYQWSDNGSGAGGQHVLDLHRNAATIYTERSTDDQRPVLAYDATDLVVQGKVHEQTELFQNDILTLEGDEFPDSDATFPDQIDVFILCRKP